MRTFRSEELLRVATVNLLWHIENREQRARAIAQHLKDKHVDVVTLSEVEQVSDTWRDSPSTAEAVAEELGFHCLEPANLESAGAGEPRTKMRTWPAIVSRWPLEELTGLNVPAQRNIAVPRPKLNTVVGRMQAPGKADLLIISSHLAWGGDSTGVRREQVATIDKFVQRTLQQAKQQSEHMGTLGVSGAVWGGDFNCVPSNDAKRFLDGDHAIDGHSTQWTDCWDALHPNEAGYTIGPDIVEARRTAEEVMGIDGNLLPYRRIDYLLTDGWRYGTQQLSPRKCELIVFKDGLTDHHGLYTDITW